MNSLRKIPLCALLPLLGVSASSAATLTLNAIADTYVREDNTATVAGATATELLVGQLSATQAFHGLMTFDLGTVPDNVTIDSVSLVLRQQTEDTSSSVTTLTINLHLVTESFVNSQTSWANRETGVAWTTAGGTFDSTVLSSVSLTTRPSQVSQTLPIDATWGSTASLVGALQSAANANSASISFLLKDANEDDAGRQLIRFASGEGSFTPELIINYTSAIPEPSSAALLFGGIALAATARRRRTRA